MKQEFTILLISEDVLGILNRVSLIFTRRHINIHSLTVSTTELKGVSRYTIVIECTEEMVKKLVKQIEKQVEVIRALYFTKNEMVFEEVALYKLSSDVLSDHAAEIEILIRKHGARIISLAEDYSVIEKTGHEKEIYELRKDLDPFHILEFVKSGRIAVMKRNIEAALFLKELEDAESPNGI